MTIFVVTGERTFYNDEVHRNIPEEAKPLTQECYEQLLQAQSDYKLLDFDVFPPAIKDRQNVWPAASELQALLDDKVAAVYAQWSRFEREHLLRESAARLFKDFGYEGDVSVWIKSYADSTGLTNIEATDLILKRAQQQKSLQESLATLRMRKHELDALDDEARYQRYQALMTEVDILVGADAT